MDWSQVLTLFFANAGLMIWFRAESRADWRHMVAKIESNLQGIREEMKDFHSRLCSIEERNKK